jgi:hypothetical protein
MQLEEIHTTPERKVEHVAPPPIDDTDVVCRALDVALCAVQISLAWHSGVISGNTAMAALSQEIFRVSPGTS